MNPIRWIKDKAMWLLAGAALILLLGVVVSARGWQNAAERAREAEETVQTLRAEREHIETAAHVAEAALSRERDRHAEIDAWREAVENGNLDAPIPDWIAGALDSLLAPSS